MKTSMSATVTEAILVLLLSIGIVQAGGMHSDRPASRIEGMEALHVTNAPEEDMDGQPLFVANAPEEDMDEQPLFIANAPEEDMDEQPLFVANAPEVDNELEGPIAAGNIPNRNDVDSDDVDSEDQGGYTF